MTAQFIDALLQQASHDGSRSTVLKPLSVILTVFLSAILLSFAIEAPVWLGITLTVLMIIILILFIYAYLHFMKSDPDSLRSEKYSLQKMQIEKGIYGDDSRGVVEQASKNSDTRYSIEHGSDDSGVQQ